MSNDSNLQKPDLQRPNLQRPNLQTLASSSGSREQPFIILNDQDYSFDNINENRRSALEPKGKSKEGKG